MKFKEVPKLKTGDKVAILSPSFAAPGMFPEFFELGLKRLQEIFKLEPVECATTRQLGASIKDRAKDLVAAFEDPKIKGVITSIGGDDQVTYVKNLPTEPFIKNPKPFFGFSDNTHLANFLWLNGIPSFYGGAVMTQLAEPGSMDDFTIAYLKKAFFEQGEFELLASQKFSEVDLDWGDSKHLTQTRSSQVNNGWDWQGSDSAKGITWGGCLESIDEILRHGLKIPTLKQFEEIILLAETSEEVPAHDYVMRVFRALGERGILERLQGVLIGRPKAWSFDRQLSLAKRNEYREKQGQTVLELVRKYNSAIPVVQGLDFGHTSPQIAMPYGSACYINSDREKIFVRF